MTGRDGTEPGAEAPGSGGVGSAGVGGVGAGGVGAGAGSEAASGAGSDGPADGVAARVDACVTDGVAVIDAVAPVAASAAAPAPIGAVVDAPWYAPGVRGAGVGAGGGLGPGVGSAGADDDASDVADRPESPASSGRPGRRRLRSRRGGGPASAAARRPAAGRRPPSAVPLPQPYSAASAWFLAVVPYLFVAIVIVADVSTAKDTTFTPMLPVVPALAALGRRSVRGVLVATAVAAGALLALTFYNTAVPPDAYWAAFAALVTVAAVSCVSINVLRHQSQVLADVRSVAEAAQHVVLRDIPADLSQVRTASAYEAADAEARIGGDLYEGLATRYGDRFIIGDVRGKGLPAVEAAADVLGVFRDAAHTEPDLAAVAVRLDAALARRPVRDEEFVTAALLSVSPDTGSVEIVNCGHPAPLLLRHGRVAALAPDRECPPLGLFDLTDPKIEPYHARFLPGDTLLLYTDGTTEARDASGRFFPLTQYLGGVRFGEPGELIELVRIGLRLHSGEQLDDDVALVAVQRKENVVTEFAGEAGMEAGTEAAAVQASSAVVPTPGSGSRRRRTRVRGSGDGQVRRSSVEQRVG